MTNPYEAIEVATAADEGRSCQLPLLAVQAAVTMVMATWCWPTEHSQFVDWVAEPLKAAGFSQAADEQIALAIILLTPIVYLESLIGIVLMLLTGWVEFAPALVFFAIAALGFPVLVSFSDLPGCDRASCVCLLLMCTSVAAYVVGSARTRPRQRFLVATAMIGLGALSALLVPAALSFAESF